MRFLLLYLVSGLAGSAGALIANPNAVTVGASGAIFGILGAAIVLERQRTYVLGGSALTLLIVNLAFTFAVPGISIGGHLGGLAGGALCDPRALALRQAQRRLQPDRPALDREPRRDRRPQRRRRLLEGHAATPSSQPPIATAPMPCSASAAWAAARRASGTRYGEQQT